MTLTQIEKLTNTALTAVWTLCCRLLPSRASTAVHRKYGFAGHRLAATFRKAPNYRPALLAETAAAIDELAGGRLDLGIGAGWTEMEHRMFAIPSSPLRERMDE